MESRLRRNPAANFKVERLDCVLDWKQFFQAWETLGIHGHVQTKCMTEEGVRAPHCFRFVKRRDLPASLEIENAFTGHEAHEFDCVMLVKPFLASTEFAQKPLVCCPFAFMEMLPRDGPPPVGVRRAPLSSVQRKEFLKSAAKFRTEPWSYARAADYLERFVHNNAVDQDEGVASMWSPAPIEFVRRGVRAKRGSLDNADTHLPVGLTNHYALATPGVVQVGPEVPRRRLASKRNSGGASSIQGAPAAAADSELGAPPGVIVPPQPVRRRRAQDVLPADLRGIRLGCAKCRRSPVGCTRCRTSAGLVNIGGAWSFNDALMVTLDASDQPRAWRPRFRLRAKVRQQDLAWL